MSTIRNGRKPTADEFAALVDAARASAERARRDALAAGWTAAKAWIARGWNRFLSSPGAVFDRPVNPSWPHATR